jgi:acyl-CoA reductase-like NAD-dependent aldehyde dehydrogenase
MLGRRVLSFSGQISRRHISVVSPATKQVVAELNSDTAETVKQKAKNSRVAQSSWKNVPLSDRIAAIKQFRDALANPDTISQFAQDLSAETGKPVSQAAGEIKGTLGRIDFFTEHVENVLQPVNLPARG